MKSVFRFLWESLAASLVITLFSLVLLVGLVLFFQAADCSWAPLPGEGSCREFRWDRFKDTIEEIVSKVSWIEMWLWNLVLAPVMVIIFRLLPRGSQV